MQMLIENLVFAFVGAIAILIVILLLGVGVGYRDAIIKRRIDIYARVIMIPLFLFVTVYLYLQGILAPDAIFIALVWLVPIILCTDWSRLRGTNKEQE